MADIYVISGAMCSGKTSLLNKISKKIQIYSIAEVARYLIELEQRSGKPRDEWIVPSNRKYFLEFQKRVFMKQCEWLDSIPKYIEKVIMDRSDIDCLAYMESEGYHKDKLFKQMFDIIKNRKYSKVFICKSLNIKTKDSIREDIEKQSEIEKLIWKYYKFFSYNPIEVPSFSPENPSKKEIEDAIEKRAEFVISHIK